MAPSDCPDYFRSVMSSLDFHTGVCVWVWCLDQTGPVKMISCGPSEPVRRSSDATKNIWLRTFCYHLNWWLKLLCVYLWSHVQKTCSKLNDWTKLHECLCDRVVCVTVIDHRHMRAVGISCRLTWWTCVHERWKLSYNDGTKEPISDNTRVFLSVHSSFTSVPIALPLLLLRLLHQRLFLWTVIQVPPSPACCDRGELCLFLLWSRNGRRAP